MASGRVEGGGRFLALVAILLSPFALAALAGEGGPAWAVDGTAIHGQERKWDWLELRSWRRFYGFVAAVSVLEVCLFATLAVRG